MLRQLASKYIDTGKAKVTYHNFVAIGNESLWAAEAAECAGEQGAGKYWEFATYLFEHQNGENQGAFNKDRLKVFAQTLKLDATAFGQCLDSDKYANSIQQETRDGQAKGIQATPTFIVNGKSYPGLLTSSQLSQIIDSLAP